MTFDTSLLRDARSRTLALVADLSDEQLQVPVLEHINPLLWEIGHVAYLAEFWTLRHLRGRPPIMAQSDAFYDSAKTAHDTRWTLPIPGRSQTQAYLDAQLEATIAAYGLPGDDDKREYFYHLVLFHEDMHGEALIYTRQSLGYTQPAFLYRERSAAGPLEGDVSVPGGRYTIGTQPGEPRFAFDNEKWAHEVELDAFRISRAPVTNAQYREFVEAGGYDMAAVWSDEGNRWRTHARAQHPVYWRRGTNGWERRHFDRWIALGPHEPVVYVNHFEAQAYCNWAQRRLPVEAEWEVAATGADTAHANLGARYGNVLDVAAIPQGESRYGCRQMMGNVWEWTATPFGPYPGFEPDPYKEYSQPWFGDHYVLRGGAWSTRERLISTRWRNFYRPHRRDIITGFRTCAVDS